MLRSCQDLCNSAGLYQLELGDGGKQTRISDSVSSSSFSCRDSPIDIITMFYSAPARVHTKAAEAGDGAPLAAAASSCVISSPSAAVPQQTSLSSVLYNVDLDINANGESEIRFEVAHPVNQSTAPELWRHSGSAAVGAHTQCCCFSADSKYFITAGYNDHNIRLWNPSTRGLVAALAGHKSTVYSVTSFHLHGKIILASGSCDSTIHIWQLKDPAPSSLLITTLLAESFVIPLVYCRNQRILISGQSDHTLKFWCATTWQCVQTLTSSSFVRALSLSFDESKLASGHEDGSIRIWDMDSRTKVKIWKAATQRIAHNGLCFSPSKPDVLVAVSFDGTCSTWNCNTGTKMARILTQSETYYSPCSFSLDGQYFVSVSSSFQLVLIDAATNTVIKIMDHCPSITYISSACFSPNGKYLACATYNASTLFHVWESPLPLVPSAICQSIIPEAASEFRLVPMTESNCLIIVRLCSNKWTAAIAECSADKVILKDWITIPVSFQCPIARSVTVNGETIKIEDKSSPSIPIFIGKNATNFTYAAAVEQLNKLLTEKAELAKQVELTRREEARVVEEAAKPAELAKEDLNGQTKHDAAAPVSSQCSNDESNSSLFFENYQPIVYSLVSSSMPEPCSVCSPSNLVHKHMNGSSCASWSSPVAAAKAEGRTASGLIDLNTILIGDLACDFGCQPKIPH